MDKFVDFFQICHSIEQPICKQHKCKAAEKRKHKEANQEKDTVNKIHTAACCKNSSNNNPDLQSKCVCQEN